ncbi:MAG: hypothetical protein U0T75_12550 [Chitinophagales bacterium]
MRVIKLAVVVIAVLAIVVSGCKGKKGDGGTKPSDTTSVAQNPTPGTLTLPHADSTLIPVLGAVVDEVFTALAKKDNKAFASYFIYRGPDSLRVMNDVFGVSTPFERDWVRITAAAFTKWNKDVESREYTRIYLVPLSEGVQMPVLEVVFISPKSVNRKFFGFLQVAENDFRILEVTSQL